MKSFTLFTALLLVSTLPAILHAQPDPETDTAYVRKHRVRIARCYSGSFLYTDDSIPGVLQSIMTFDKKGQLVEKKTPSDGGFQTETNFYDQKGLLKKVLRHNPRNSNSDFDSILYEYDSLGREIRYVTYLNGRKETSRNSYWDEKNREVRREEYRNDSVLSSKILLEYDGDSQRLTMQYDKGGIYTQNMVKDTDERGNLLTKEYWAADTLSSKENYEYNDQNQLTQHSWVDLKGNPTFIKQYIWSHNQLTRQDYSEVGKAPCHNQYEYFPNGLLHRTLKGVGTPNYSGGTQYSYDDKGRLSGKSAKDRKKGFYLLEKISYDETGNRIREEHFLPGDSIPYATTLFSYETGTNRLLRTGSFYEQRGPLQGEPSDPDIYTYIPCLLRDTTTVSYHYKDNLIDAEYTTFYCRETLDGFLPLTEEYYGPEFGPISYQIVYLDTLRQSSIGPVFTTELIAGIPGPDQNKENYVRVTRTIEVSRDAFIHIRDIGPDGKVWLDCSQKNGIVSGEYLSKNYSRSGNTEVIYNPYLRDTLKVNRFDKKGRLVETDSIRNGEKCHLVLEYAGERISKTSFNNTSYGANSFVYYYNDKNEVIEIRGFMGPDLNEVIFFTWENGRIVEETAPEFYGQTFSRWEYEYYKD